MNTLKQFIEHEYNDFTKLNDIIIDRGIDGVCDLTNYDYEYKQGVWQMVAESDEIRFLWVFDNEHECIYATTIWERLEPEEEEEENWFRLTEEEEIAYNKYDDERGAWELWE